MKIVDAETIIEMLDLMIRGNMLINEEGDEFNKGFRMGLLQARVIIENEMEDYGE